MIGGLLVATPSVEAKTAARSVSVKISASNVNVGQKVTFSGKATQTAKGSAVKIQALSGKKWKTLTTTKTTNTKGSYKATITDKRAGHVAFRVYLPQNSKTKALTSVKKYIDGYKTATAALTSPSTVSLPAGTNTTTLSGKITPYVAGAAVTLQRQNGKTWATVSATTVTKTGTFSQATNAVADGASVIFRFTVAQAKYVRSATSNTTTVTVTPAQQQQQPIPTPTPTEPTQTPIGPAPTPTAPTATPTSSAPTQTVTTPAPAPTTPVNLGIPTAERAAIVDLYDATIGPGSWDVAGYNVCSSGSVTCSNGHITKLDLFNSGLSGAVPESFGNLTNLTWLSFGDNHLNALPESFGNLSNLATLELKTNDFTLSSFPESFGNLTSLTYLDLSYNSLTELPNWIGNLTNLRNLLIDNFTGTGQGLTSLPESMQNLTNLSSLDLYGNQLETLPDWFGNLTSLTNLTLAGNQLSSLPDVFGSLTKLTSLVLYSNQLSGDISGWATGLMTAITNSNNDFFINLSLNGCMNSGSNSELATWLTNINSNWLSECSTD